MNASLDLVRALDPGERHLVEEGFISVVRHGPCQTQAFDRFPLILGCPHSRTPQKYRQSNSGTLLGHNLGRNANSPARACLSCATEIPKDGLRVQLADGELMNPTAKRTIDLDGL
jgi:hypothetical protein